ncbi:MAG: D-alanyl-D-alanine carboxypeptidase [Pyrinomonadaceae bacterium]|nr:D-alanyl-D-alanine carboxypeptidase [Pyrinomonadaceae bacterium]
MKKQARNRFTLWLMLLLWLPVHASAQETARPTTPPPVVADPSSTVKRTVYTPATPSAEDVVPLPYGGLLTGREGILVESRDGRTQFEQQSNVGFNPASTIKLATALAALRTFGPNHRFNTVLWTNGRFDQATSTIEGDLIISGRDPSFNYEHAMMLAGELNKLGIRTVTGDLIVAPGFTMNYSPSALRSGENFYDTLDATRRPTGASRAWSEYQRVAASVQSRTLPSVGVMGAVYVASVPAGARQLLLHRSSTLVDVLKVLECYSNNFMADRLGDQLGGPEGLERFLASTVGVNPSEVYLATASGLGVNRVTPRAMMKIWRALVAELGKHKLVPSDILPVAGVDPGTLRKRYTSPQSRGSVIGKTGTLGRTDGGASALVGQMRTRTGETLYFVIFNQRGSVWRFRQMQDEFVWQLQSERGGPAPFVYTARSLALRLNNTESRATGTDEYEPN